MLKKLILLCVLISVIPLLSGCLALLVGGAAGYEVSSDSVKGYFDTSFSRAYKVSLKTAKSLGSVNMEDEVGGWIKFDSQAYNVAIHIEKSTEKTVQITVSARKHILPKVQFAKDILAKISKKLK